MTQPHRSRNTMFWRRDPFVAEASKHPGWNQFHRECGKAGLFFDDVDPVGDDGKDVTRRPKRGYSAVAFRVEDGRYRYVVAQGRGEGPIAAVIAAYRAAIDEGFAAPAGLDAIFDDTPTGADPLMDLIG